MSKRFTGNIITDTPQIPQNNYQDTPASGVWGIYEVADLVERGLWPTLGNLNPSAFVENIFSTYLYHGTQTQVGGNTITNNIDLATEGGMVWFKARDAASSATITDTVMGAGNYLQTASTAAQSYSSAYMTSFNTDGFTLGAFSGFTNSDLDYASWTFRKAPKFFDVVTYTGNGSPRTIAHNLGTTPGCIMVKNLSDGSSDWAVYHRGIGAGFYLILNRTSSQTAATSGSAAKFNNTAPTSSVFSVGTNNYETNLSGNNYVAYLFAHHDGDGTFGLTGDQDIISCGSYSGNGSTQEIDLGFEAQWVMIKKSSGSGEEGWVMQDVMRGMHAIGNTHDDRAILANSSTAEFSLNNIVGPTPNGFILERGDGSVNASSSNYIYIAIRRGPMAVPTSGTDVFDPVTFSGNGSSDRLISSDTGVVDFAIFSERNAGSGSGYIHGVVDRLRGTKELRTTPRGTEISSSSFPNFDSNEGLFVNNVNIYNNGSGSVVANMWKRAPNFFDVITWKVDGTGDQTINHNLGVVPEMVWTKNRDDNGSGSGDWWIAHKDMTGWDSSSQNDRHAFQGFAYNASAQQGYHRDFSSTSIRLLSNAAGGYTTGHDCIGYLFASLDGVSKVGSFTGNGSSQTIDCGFSSGARFILIKRTDSGSSWVIYDTARGIVSGADGYLALNTTSTELTYDDIDTHSSGFIVNGPSVSGTSGQVNVSGASYIFYAVA